MENYSVLMAVYYREKAEYLRQAIDSMLRQTIPPEQFVLVCDGPLTEQLDAVIEGYAADDPEVFCVVRLKENGGLGTALHLGLLHCRNELVARMDSDDIALPDRMEKQLHALHRFPDISVLGGQIAEFREDPGTVTAYREVPTGEAEILEFMKYRNPMNHVTVVLRRSHVLAAGSYPLFFGPGFEDYYLWADLASRGCRFSNIPEVCCKVRVNDGQYCRRGGWNYFRNAVKVQRLLLKTGRISLLQFGVNTAVWFCGSLLLPVTIRKSLFLRYLRREVPAGQEKAEMAPVFLSALGSRQL